MSAIDYGKRFSTVNLNALVPVVVAGLVAGIVAGLGARIAMRAVALIGGQEPSFTVSGTMFILIVGAIFGAVFGLAFFGWHRFVPLSPIPSGLVFGLLLFTLFVAPPFLLQPEGELALVTPIAGLALFGPLPLAYGLVLGALVNRWAPALASEDPRRIGIAWLGLNGLAIVLLAVGVGTLMSETMPLPQVPQQAALALGIRPAVFHSMHSMIVMAVTLVYGVLVWAIFWKGAEHRMGRLTTLALLGFAAAFFNNGTAFAGMMRALPVVRLVPAALRLVGFMGLILWLYLFPDGRFRPGWTRPLAFAWLIVAIVWFLQPVPGAALNLARGPAWFQYLILITALVTGLMAQVERYRWAGSPGDRLAAGRVVIGVSATVVTFGILLGVLLLVPGLRGRVSPGLAILAPFAFGPYLLAWLPLPVAVLAALRRGLWRENVPERVGTPVP